MNKNEEKSFLCRSALTTFAVLAVVAATTQAIASPSDSSWRAHPWAANVDMGFTNQTGDGSFDTHALLGASLEKFTAPNVSWRGSISMHSFRDPAFQQPFRTLGDEDVTAFNGNVLYHWTGGNAEPFVTGGAGLYDYHRSFDADRMEAGVDAGGGIDFFAAPTVAIKLEALYHQTTANSHDSFVAGTAGIRFRW
jgi:hypothetical protein